jgi:hypothetical protein
MPSTTQSNDSKTQVIVKIKSGISLVRKMTAAGPAQLFHDERN